MGKGLELIFFHWNLDNKTTIIPHYDIDGKLLVGTCGQALKLNEFEAASKTLVVNICHTEKQMV